MKLHEEFKEYETMWEDLNEWVDSKGRKSPLSTSSTVYGVSSTNGKKLEAIVYYMIKNKGSDVIDARHTRLDDNGFIYAEKHKQITTGEEYLIAASCSCRPSGAWTCSIYKDKTNLIGESRGKKWEELLNFLSAYFNVPASQSPAYKSIVQEELSCTD